MGPFQNMHCADASGRTRIDPLRHDVIRREQEPPTGALRRVHHAARILDPLRLHERPPSPLAPRRHERVRHRSPDRERIGVGRQGLEHGQLVRHLGTAEHHQQGPYRLAHAAQVPELALEQLARRHVREQRRHTGRGGVGPVCRPEGVIHVGVGEGGQRAREVRIVARFARVEAQVLEQDRPAVLQLRDGPQGFLSDAVAAEGDAGGEQLCEPRRHRPQCELGNASALGAAEVRAHDDACAGLEQAAQRGQAGADPGVVGDLPVCERHVQVGTHEHPPTPHAPREELVERRYRHRRGQRPILSARSTTRLE
jgi:hypothetical protein